MGSVDNRCGAPAGRPLLPDPLSFSIYENLLLTLLLGAAAAPARASDNLSPIDYASGSDNESHNNGFGTKGGYNLSNIYGSGKDLLSPEAQNAFHGGVYG